MVMSVLGLVVRMESIAFCSSLLKSGMCFGRLYMLMMVWTGLVFCLVS
jgi:hypothetical protein